MRIDASRFSLTHAFLRALDDEGSLPLATYVDQIDRARRPGGLWGTHEDKGIPSIFHGFRTHRGEWIP